jgi:hypothetical protein
MRLDSLPESRQPGEGAVALAPELPLSAPKPAQQSPFLKCRALMLPKEARYNELMRLPKG